jgi:alpha 1,3-glucosidase
LLLLRRHTNQTGVPLMRPLWFEFPEQTGLYGTEEEFLLGPGILVKPVLEVGALLHNVMVGGVSCRAL